MMSSDEDVLFMGYALALAKEAAALGEVPVGCVIVREGEVLGSGYNRPIAAHDPTAHAEIEALRAAGQRLGNYRLSGSTLYVTLEPCVMCAGAMVHARISRLVFATADPRAGAAGSAFDIVRSANLNHRLEVSSGVLEDECRALLQDFFRSRR